MLIAREIRLTVPRWKKQGAAGIPSIKDFKLRFERRKATEKADKQDSKSIWLAALGMDKDGNRSREAGR